MICASCRKTAGIGIRNRDGQSLVEYALILVFLVLAAIVGLGLFGTQLLRLYNFVVSQWPAA